MPKPPVFVPISSLRHFVVRIKQVPLFKYTHYYIQTIPRRTLFFTKKERIKFPIIFLIQKPFIHPFYPLIITVIGAYSAEKLPLKINGTVAVTVWARISGGSLVMYAKKVHLSFSDENSNNGFWR